MNYYSKNDITFVYITNLRAHASIAINYIGSSIDESYNTVSQIYFIRARVDELPVDLLGIFEASCPAVLETRARGGFVGGVRAQLSYIYEGYIVFTIVVHQFHDSKMS